MKRAIGAAALAALLLAGRADASNMMPVDPSPDSGLKGIWRVIDARPAPWSTLTLHTLRDAPLLEQAVAFADGKIQGPAPLACQSARYSNGMTDLAEAFAGHLAKDASGQVAASLDLAGPALMTFRAICGNATRDFYVDAQYRLLWAEGEILYVLERPEGDPQSYPVGYSGPSFDCVQAKTTLERLVCRDAALSKSDSAMGKPYRALENSETRDSFETVRAAQKAWLAYAARSCGADAAMPDSYGDRKTVVDCLAPLYEDRSDLLSGLEVETAGALKLEPRMQFRTRLKPAARESDAWPWISGGAEADGFNAFIAGRLHSDRSRLDDHSLFPTDLEDVTLVARRTYRVAGFDGRLVSIQIATRDYTGGNNDLVAQMALTWDLARARRVLLKDVFAPGSKWAAAVAAWCRRDFKRQFPEHPGSEPGAAEIAAAIAADTSWLWGQDKATVVFMGGTGTGEIDVAIPLPVLRPYMQADAAPLHDMAENPH